MGVPRRPARTVTVGVGHWLIHGQRIPRLGATWWHTRKMPARIRAGIRQLRAQKNVIRAAGEGAAGRALAPEGATWWENWLEPPETEEGPGHAAGPRRTGPRRRAGAAAQRLAALVPAADAPATSNRRRGRADHGAVDPHPAALRRPTPSPRRPSELAGHPPRRSPGRAALGGPCGARRRFARAGRLAARNHRARAPPAGGRRPRRGANAEPRGPLRAFAMTRTNRHPPSAADWGTDGGYRDDTALGCRRDVLTSPATS